MERLPIPLAGTPFPGVGWFLGLGIRKFSTGLQPLSFNARALAQKTRAKNPRSLNDSLTRVPPPTGQRPRPAAPSG